MVVTGKRTQRDYTMAFKLAVVDQVEKGELTYKLVLIEVMWVVSRKERTISRLLIF